MLPQLYTFCDAIQELEEFAREASISAAGRACRSAIRRAYREIVASHDWTCLRSNGRIALQAYQDTGSVAYDHCVTPEHEALTRFGWKTYDQLSVGEEILAYDHDTETCSWQPIEVLHVFDYAGLVLDVKRKGRTVLRCTPNHRIPVYERWGNAKNRRYRKKFVKAKDLTEEMLTPLAAPVEIETGGELNIRMASLLAWCVTDGTGLFNRKHHKADIFQSASANPYKCADLLTLVGRSGKGSGPNMLRFPLMSKDRNNLRQKVRDKTDLPRIVAQMGVQEAEATTYAMMEAEGSTCIKNNQSVFSQWGDNRPVAEAFQIACTLAGKAANWCERTYDTIVGLRQRYQLTVRHSRRIRLKRQSSWVHYKGIVWCPQVRTSAWVMRCNGAVMLTGNSGGTYERQLTLTGATWPADAIDWAVRIDTGDNEVVCDIEERKSNTVVTLNATMCPVADVAAGATFIAYPRYYRLPNDFCSMDAPVEEALQSLGQYVSPSEMLRLDRYYNTSGEICYYTIAPVPDLYGTMGLFVQPYSDENRTLDFIYNRKPRELRYVGTDLSESPGTIAVVAGTATVTASGTGTSGVFTDEHVGSLLRIGTSTTKLPTGLDGLLPYAEQRVIASCDSDTVVTLDANISTSRSGVKYSITDPIDLDALVYDAMMALAKQYLAIEKNAKNWQQIAGMATNAIFRAKCGDNRVTQRRVAGIRRTYEPRLSDSPQSHREAYP